MAGGNRRGIARRRAIPPLFGVAGVLVLSCGWTCGQEQRGGTFAGAAPVDVNAEGRTYDSEASLAVSPDGAEWTAWHAYYRGLDQAMAKRIGTGRPWPACVVSQEGRVHGPPVVAGCENGAWVFWPARLDRQWRILGRRIAEDTCQPIITLSDQQGDAVLPAAARFGPQSLLVSWSDCRRGKSRICSRLWENGKWRKPEAVSSGSFDAFRSALAVASGGEAWIVWDEYENGCYAIWGRRWLPAPGPIERISPSGENCLTPTALAAQQGICAAWLQVTDVIGGEGVISQRHTLHMAIRSERGWRMVRDAAGCPDAAALDYGLMTKIEPEPVATGGYLGRRRRPMLLEDGETVWLLWERKGDHEGRTPNVVGDLIGRPCRKSRWDAPVVLHRGYLDYRVADDARAADGQFTLLASDLPRNGRRVYHRLAGRLAGGTPLLSEPWTGWRPVKLPLRVQDPPRREIRQGQTVYRLYWADLHCHSNLSADAEGEPDELLHYARDRARLDVVVFTENDAIYDVFLTEGEFAYGMWWANRFTRPGRFVALPGYEWSSRIPKSPDVDLADPRNWDARYYGTAPKDWAKTASGISSPDHRSVIYPPEGGPVVRYPEVGNDVRKLVEAVALAGGLAHPHHAAWRLSGNPVEANIEVTSGWDIYIRDPSRIHQELRRGRRFGFLGNSDSHRRNPGLGGGLTGIYAEALTPEAILEALRSRRVYATSGSRIVVDSRAGGSLMGQEAAAPEGDIDIQLDVVGARPILEAALIRDGDTVKTFAGYGSSRLSVVHHERSLSRGVHWCYWRIVQQGASPNYPGNVKTAEGPLAWSSPHWVIVP